MRNQLHIVIIVAILLSGCSRASTIQKANMSTSAFDDAVLYKGKTTIVNDKILDDDAYRVFHRAATGFVSINSIRISAEKRASTFCAKKGKVVEILRERTSGPPLPGNFPRIELIFACVVPVDSSNASDGLDKYEQLRKLKSLLDDGVITNEEFISEKNKLLS